MNWLTAPLVWIGKQIKSVTGSVADATQGVANSIARKFQRKYRFANVEELPDQLRPFTLYVAGEGENVWAASMICPCGCKEVIELNLLQQVRPRWAVTRNPDGTASLKPSVWRQKGCRSHFVLRDGNIRWC